MDGRTRYNKVKQILKPIVGQTMHMEKIRRRVIIDVGSSDTVVMETMRLMIDLGLIREVSAFMFKVERCEADI